jgi:hypothetical protein
MLCSTSTIAPELGSYNQQGRQTRADGGKVYPAKKGAERMERSLKRAQRAIAEQTKPIMDLNDSVVAHALEIASTKSLGSHRPDFLMTLEIVIIVIFKLGLDQAEKQVVSFV